MSGLCEFSKCVCLGELLIFFLFIISLLFNLHAFIQPNGNNEYRDVICDEQPAQKNLLITCQAVFSIYERFCMNCTGYGKFLVGFIFIFRGFVCLKTYLVSHGENRWPFAYTGHLFPASKLVHLSVLSS